MIHEVLSELFVHNMELFYIVMRLQSNVGEEIDEGIDYEQSAHTPQQNAHHHLYLYIIYMFINKRLKSIDFYQAVHSEVHEGTISGGCISLFLLLILIATVISAISQYRVPSYSSDLIIDQSHLNTPLKVMIDISFPHYPCAALSLDIENELHKHKINIGQTIRKYQLPSSFHFEEPKSEQEQKQQIEKGFKEGRGCRMRGYFQIDRVPGNFHFSCHGYYEALEKLFSEGFQLPTEYIDMSHTIHELYFSGEVHDQRRNSNLRNFTSTKEIEEDGTGIAYIYFLSIMEENFLMESSTSENYHFTVRTNQINAFFDSPPLVVFDYQTNPMTTIIMKEEKRLSHLLIELVGLFGGIVTVARIADRLIHSSVSFLIEKHQMGKLI